MHFLSINTIWAFNTASATSTVPSQSMVCQVCYRTTSEDGDCSDYPVCHCEISLWWATNFTKLELFSQPALQGYGAICTSGQGGVEQNGRYPYNT